MSTEQQPSPETMILQGHRLVVDGGLKTERFSPQKVKRLTGIDQTSARLMSKRPEILERLLNGVREFQRRRA